MRESQIFAIAEALRVAYLRGTADPSAQHMTATIHELRDFVIRRVREGEDPQ